MKTKLLYVLASSSDDTFLEQAHISITSAKKQMPDCHVVLLVDEKTDAAMDKNRKKILEKVDEYIVIPLEETSTHERSRFLKCNARSYVQGDFLYIDVDTIITKPLYEIDNVVSSIGLVRERNKEIPNYTWHDKEMCQYIDFSLDNTLYYNGGLVYAKDDEKAHEFYSMWLDEWQKGRKVGMYLDQPSLAKTVSKLGCEVLPDVWNVQLQFGLHYIYEAKIIHYLNNSNTRFFHFHFPEAFLLLKEDMDNINDNFYKDIMNNIVRGFNRPTVIVSGREILLRMTWMHSALRGWFDDRNKFNRIQSFCSFLAKLKHFFVLGWNRLSQILRF